MKIDFIKLNREQIQRLGEVKTVNTFDYKNDFHEDGLFSLSIFGQLGTQERKLQFGYINLNCEIMSPHLFYEVGKLSGFYEKIIAGKAFATWNDDEKIFEPSNFEDGETGYSFFMNKVKEIKWAETKSDKRKQKIDLLKQHEKNMFIEHLIVRPAGLREYMITSDGKGKEDEVNPFYRRIIGVAQILGTMNSKDKSADIFRYRLQMVIQEIYKLVYRVSSGKGGVIQNNWTKRGLDGSTRNVITASTVPIEDLRDERQLNTMVDINTTIIGLYQYTKSIMGKADFYIRSLFLENILGDGSNFKINLVNKETGKVELVESPEEVIKYMSSDGIDKYIVDALKEKDYVHQPITLGDYYLCNIYDDGKVVKVLFDNTLPEDRDIKYVRPITLIELITISILGRDEIRVGEVTRFPITAEGSTYPTKFYVRTTVRDEPRILLDSNWEPIHTIQQYPIKGKMPFMSMTVHASKLNNLGADHDGDKMPASSFLLNDTIQETMDKFNEREFYVTVAGQWVSSLSSKVSKFTLQYLTKG